MGGYRNRNCPRKAALPEQHLSLFLQVYDCGCCYRSPEFYSECYTERNAVSYTFRHAFWNSFFYPECYTEFYALGDPFLNPEYHGFYFFYTFFYAIKHAFGNSIGNSVHDSLFHPECHGFANAICHPIRHAE
ncbi:MAG TPA: hypothetical protein P5031_06820 [Candidatus Syntrophosphaera sp.]|jgi:hypothetical protein|nr:hypothetical protein [Candidatus Syntrophosphaera sp.]